MGHSLALHGEIPAPRSRPGFAIAGKGFRPFFLLAAIYAVAVVPLWLAIIAGVALPSAYLDPIAWHAHEMVFGFAAAVIGGFLLTAVGNWTQRETLIGAPLLVLSGVWLAGRLAMILAAHLPRGVPALVDLAFLPLLAVAIARPLVATRNRRNFVMVGMLAALFAANVAVHLDGLHVLPSGSALRACGVGVDLVVLMIVVISGRVIPMFTRNATKVASIRSIPALDGIAAGAVAVVALLDAFAVEAHVAGVVAGGAGLLAFARTIHWGTRHAFRQPLLWILHTGHAWAALGLVLRGPAAFPPAFSNSLATHALTVGAIGSLTLGMMARVSLGHSGRALVAPRAMGAAFVAISAAAVIRVFAPLVIPERTFQALVVAGALWTFAFGAFLFVYAPILATPRVDGKPG